MQTFPCWKTPDTGVGSAKVNTNSALLCHFAKLLKPISAILKVIKCLHLPQVRAVTFAPAQIPSHAGSSVS